MTAPQLIAHAQGLGVLLWRDGDALAVRGPVAKLSSRTLERLKEMKPVLLPLLPESPPPIAGEPMQGQSFPDLVALGWHGVMAHYATQCGQDYDPERPEALLPDAPSVSAERSVFAAWTARQVEGQELCEIYPEVWHEIGELLEEPLDLAAVLAVTGGYVVTDRYAEGLDLLPDPPSWWPKTALPPNCTFLGDGQK